MGGGVLRTRFKRPPPRAPPPFTARITTSESPPLPRPFSSTATGLSKAESSGRLMLSSWRSTWRRFSASDPGSESSHAKPNQLGDPVQSQSYEPYDKQTANHRR